MSAITPELILAITGGLVAIACAWVEHRVRYPDMDLRERVAVLEARVEILEERR